MKFIAIAFLGVVASEEVSAAAKVGTACVPAGDCGDADTMCCGTATKGLICTDEKCTATTPGDIPNLMVCNTKTTPADFTLTQAGATGTDPTIYAKYLGADWTCSGA